MNLEVVVKNVLLGFWRILCSSSNGKVCHFDEPPHSCTLCSFNSAEHLHIFEGTPGTLKCRFNVLLIQPETVCVFWTEV